MNQQRLQRKPSGGVDIKEILNELVGKRVTTGRIFDSNGSQIYKEIEAGGNGALVQAANKYLKAYSAPINPRAKYYTSARHVETQYAMWMCENGVTSATVVMNNARGVCGGMYGCQSSVSTILPVGSTMTIWYLGATEPRVLPGEAVAP